MKTYQLIIVILAALFAGTVPSKTQAGTPCPPSRSQCRSEAEYVHRCREYQQYVAYQERLRYEAYVRQMQYQQQMRYSQSRSYGYPYGYSQGSSCGRRMPAIQLCIPIRRIFSCR